MKNLTAFTLLILFSVGLGFAQKLPGSWHNADNNITITMMTDGNFLTRAGQNLITGTYFKLGKVVTTQDPSGTYTYQITKFTQDELTLVDANNNALPLKRMTPPVQLPDADRFPQVHAEAGKFQVREADIRLGIATIEFLTSKSLPQAQADRLRKSAIDDFNKDPKEFNKGMKLLRGIMDQVALYSDPIALALLRSQLYGIFYAANMNTAEADRSELVNITVEELPVLAYDSKTQLVLSERDLEAALIYLERVNQLNGNAPMQAAQKAQLKTYITDNFNKLSQQDQQFYANASMFAEMLDYQINQFSPQQKQQFSQNWQQQISQPQAVPNWGNQANNNMDAETYRFLSQLSLQNHVSMLNGIEAMGGSSDYWEIKPGYLGSW